jgi:integrase/recombinase XerD
MTLSSAISLSEITMAQAQSLKEELIWDKMGTIKVHQEIEWWLLTHKDITRTAYRYHLQCIETQGLIDSSAYLKSFSILSHNNIVDRIKQQQGPTEATKQARASAYISFTKYLSRKYEGKISRAETQRGSANPTFFKIRDKCSTMAMQRQQWIDFLYYLHKSNPKYYLIATLMIQGAKRISEVLSLQSDKINWTTCEITFRQLKNKNTFKETIITYPARIMEQLKAHVGSNSGLVFTTSTGKQIQSCQVATSFAIAGSRANIPFHIHPHVLRATAITAFFKEGLSAFDIAKISGHASLDSVCTYDKASIADNATKRISLV